jgi:hypothetical protein
VILTLPRSAWQPTISADGAQPRETGEVAEITDLVGLSEWPAGTRMLVRREHPNPGAQLRFTELDGYRFQVFVPICPTWTWPTWRRSTAAAAALNVPSAT